jgi:outer membrane protein TolC
MPRRKRSYIVCRRIWPIALGLATGCVHPRAHLDDALEQRVLPREVGPASSTGQDKGNASNEQSKDRMIRPASAALPDVETRAQREQPAGLPPALAGPSPRAETNRLDSPATSLPGDSDEATLDAIAATGKVVTLPDAVKLAFHHQPRLRAQLETIAQARGAQQIVFSTFLPTVAVNYDVGEYSLGVGGNSIPLGKGLPGFNFLPGLGALPVGLNTGTKFELAELKIQWLLLDFGRRLGRYDQAKLASDIAGLQTDRAFQTVANEVAVAFYTVLRAQALRRTTQDALRRADEELGDAKKLEREGVVDRESVLRAEVQRAEARQQYHAATESEFIALAGLNLAIGLKCNQPLRVDEPPEIPPLARSLADCLDTAVHERREFSVVQSTVDIAVQGGRVARADFAPKVIADGTILNFQQQSQNGHADLRLGFIRLEWTLFEGGRRIAAARVADSQVRQAMAQAESIADQIAYQVNEAYRNAVTARVSIDDARPAVEQATENYRLVQLRLREGSATPTEIADAQASLTRAQQNYLNARYSYLIAMDRLDYAMGVGQTPMAVARSHH